MVLASVSPLSRPPVPYEELREYRLDYLSAYDVILNAERLAKEQVEADPSNREVSCPPDYLLELFDRREILSGRPYVSLAKQISSQPWEFRDAHDVAFRVGDRLLDRLLRLCLLDSLPAAFGHLPRSTPRSFATLEDMTRDCTMTDSKDYRTVRRKV